MFYMGGEVTLIYHVYFSLSISHFHSYVVHFKCHALHIHNIHSNMTDQCREPGIQTLSPQYSPLYGFDIELLD